MWGLLGESAITILVHVLRALPHIEADVREALAANWSKDYVQDALRSVDLLGKIVQDVADTKGEAAPVHVAPAVATDQSGVAPGAAL